MAGCHVTVCRGTYAQNLLYCSKNCLDADGGYTADFHQRGDPPLDPVDKAALGRKRYSDAWEAAKRGDIESIDPDLRLRHYSTIRRIATDFAKPLASLPGPCGIWIWGEAGAGKSSSVLGVFRADRTVVKAGAFPNAYSKPLPKENRWWDGYDDAACDGVVLLDDFDRFMIGHAGNLKIWAGENPFRAEIKGGSILIRPRKLIVTSQYSIEEIFAADDKTMAALTRRFTVIKKEKDQDIILRLNPSVVNLVE